MKTYRTREEALEAAKEQIEGMTDSHAREVYGRGLEIGRFNRRYFYTHPLFEDKTPLPADASLIGLLRPDCSYQSFTGK
jgi:hypothetical protein